MAVCNKQSQVNYFCKKIVHKYCNCHKVKLKSCLYKFIIHASFALLSLFYSVTLSFSNG